MGVGGGEFGFAEGEGGHFGDAAVEDAGFSYLGLGDEVFGDDGDGVLGVDFEEGGEAVGADAEFLVADLGFVAQEGDGFDAATVGDGADGS